MSKRERIIDYYINNEENDIIIDNVMTGLLKALKDRDKGSKVLERLLSAVWDRYQINYRFDERLGGE